MLAIDTILIDATRFQMGFKDGTRSMMRGSMCDDVSYLAGFNAGIKLYRSSRVPRALRS